MFGLVVVFVAGVGVRVPVAVALGVSERGRGRRRRRGQSASVMPVRPAALKKSIVSYHAKSYCVKKNTQYIWDD